MTRFSIKRSIINLFIEFLISNQERYSYIFLYILPLQMQFRKIFTRENKQELCTFNSNNKHK